MSGCRIEATKEKRKKDGLETVTAEGGRLAKKEWRDARNTDALYRSVR